MSLVGSHKNLFQIEAGVTSVWILDSLKKIEKNPSNKNEIEKLVNYADVIVGDAKFLGDKELEEIAKLIVDLFRGDKVTEQKSIEISTVIERFKNVVY